MRMLILPLLSLAVLVACKDAPPPKQAEVAPQAAHADEEEHEQLPSKVRLSPKVVAETGIKTAPATMDSLHSTIELTGEIAADPDKSARLSARVQSRVVEVRFKEGDRVKAGQVVAVLDAPELARARAELASAGGRARSARLNAQRLSTLESRSLASGQEAASAESEAAALEAQTAAARQTLAAFGAGDVALQGAGVRLTIRTPIGGFVLARDAVPGQSIPPDHVLAVVGDLERAYFLGRIFEKDLAAVKQGAIVDVRLNGYPEEVFAGVVESVGKQLDPAARTVTARIAVKNHDDLLKVGLFGTARVVTDGTVKNEKRVVVPLTAVTRIAGKDVVFVLQSDGDFEMHPVTLGAVGANRVEILSGLREGENIVVQGVFSLKSTVLKSTFGEDD